MGVLSIILLVLFVIVSLLLIFVVTIQNDDATGLGGVFGGSSNSTFGSQTSNVLKKFTAITLAVFLVGAFVLAVVNKSPSTSDITKDVTTEQISKDSVGTDWYNGSEKAPATN